MTKTMPQFLFDVGSPNAYLAHKAIPAIEQRLGITFDYVPVLLGGIFKATNNKSPMESLAGIKNKPDFHKVETERFLKRFNVAPYVWNPFFPINTLHLMRAACATQIDGGLKPYVESVYKHMWAEPKNMGDPAIAMQALAADGIDAKALFARAQDADVKERLVANTQSAVERGAFGSPTFFVDDEMFYGKEQLRDIEDHYAGR
jgi:2-hydroxychromene-2-carboxylate isomerase